MKNQAFTLIEILVVVLIIGILAAIAVPQYQKAVAKSEASESYLLLNNLFKAENAYLLATGKYTHNTADLDIKFPCQINNNNQFNACGKFYWRFCGSDLCAFAARTYGDGFYYLEVYFDTGEFICVAEHGSKAKEICFEMGFTKQVWNNSYTASGWKFLGKSRYTDGYTTLESSRASY